LLVKAALTVIVKPRDIDIDLSPSRNMKHGRFTSLISDDERGILGAVLRNNGSLGYIAA
jgi:hypothetical protein